MQVHYANATEKTTILSTVEGPYLRRWGTKELNEREDEELKRGGFGKMKIWSYNAKTLTVYTKSGGTMSKLRLKRKKGNGDETEKEKQVQQLEETDEVMQGEKSEKDKEISDHEGVPSLEWTHADEEECEETEGEGEKDKEEEENGQKNDEDRGGDEYMINDQDFEHEDMETQSKGEARYKDDFSTQNLMKICSTPTYVTGYEGLFSCLGPGAIDGANKDVPPETIEVKYTCMI